ncbi:hypothetical protein BT69DRAFT_1190247, partial [Atractiella rhizophila]
AIPFYRLLNSARSDHFYTSSASERSNAINSLGYKDEGQIGYIFPTQLAGSVTVPLYRFWGASATAHRYTIDPSERAALLATGLWRDEGIAGYVYPEATGSKPFYRLLNSLRSDHFYTSDAAERSRAISSLGYKDEGQIGYIFP